MGKVDHAVLHQPRSKWINRPIYRSSPYCSHLYPGGIYARSRYTGAPAVSDTSTSQVKTVSEKVKSIEEPVTKPGFSETDFANKLCVICYCRLKDPSLEKEIETTTCAHHFHAECLKKWKVLSSTCPVCRKTVF